MTDDNYSIDQSKIRSYKISSYYTFQYPEITKFPNTNEQKWKAKYCHTGTKQRKSIFTSTNSST